MTRTVACGTSPVGTKSISLLFFLLSQPESINDVHLIGWNIKSAAPELANFWPIVDFEGVGENCPFHSCQDNRLVTAAEEEDKLLALAYDILPLNTALVMGTPQTLRLEPHLELHHAVCFKNTHCNCLQCKQNPNHLNETKFLPRMNMPDVYALVSTPFCFHNLWTLWEILPWQRETYKGNFGRPMPGSKERNQWRNQLWQSLEEGCCKMRLGEERVV